MGATGGIFQATKGLFERFTGERVRDTPISEATFCGVGVGAAIAGMRPRQAHFEKVYGTESDWGNGAGKVGLSVLRLKQR